jgi:hypothetical protein
MADSCNVKVAVRCRPFNTKEREGNQPTIINCDSDNKSLELSVGPAGKKVSRDYTFDKILNMDSTQQEVFNSIVQPIVKETLAGYNCTIFAYGQTGMNSIQFSRGFRCIKMMLKLAIQSTSFSNQLNHKRNFN